MKCKSILDRQVLSAADEFLTAAVSLLGQARREVRIRSALLDGGVFDHYDFNQALSAFARQAADNRIFILIDYPRALLQRDHRTVALMRRLSDKILFRHFYGEPDALRDSYLLVDQQGLLIQPADKDATGVYSLTDRIQTADLLDKFNHEWQLSPQALQLRQLSI